MPFKQMENVAAYLGACKELGVGEDQTRALLVSLSLARAHARRAAATREKRERRLAVVSLRS
eukprot:5615867-Prymnesium_polylepis.1